jgi:acyl carrier protein
MNAHEARSTVLAALATIAPEADLSDLELDVEFREQLDIDSMDFLNFVIGLGEKTGRKIPEADNPKLYTLKGLIAYLAR